MHMLKFTGAFLLSLFFMLSSCSTGKKLVYTPAGNWEYSVKGTPMGDMEGTFVLSNESGKFSGYFDTEEGRGEMKDLTVDGNNMSCKFNAFGYSVDMKGLFEGESFSGTVSAQGYDFPVTAIRK